MRHLRILGLCLAALFALGAMTAVPALAKKPVSGFAKFKHCPLEAEISACTYEASAAGSEFKTGNIKVPLEKPIVLQGGLNLLESRYVEEYNPETGETERVERCPEHCGELQFAAAVGAPTLTPVEQKAPSLEEVIDPSKLSGEELRRYNKDVARGVTKGYVTIELAGNPSEIFLSTEHLLEETGPTLTLPVKVKLTSPFLGSNCYVGSDADPIEITLTTGQSGELHGFAGHLTTEEEGDILVINDNSLVNGTYASPGAEGCGKEDGANEALDSKIGIPAASGNTTTIKGTIFVSSSEIDAEHL